MIQERMYSANEYAEARDRILTLEAKVERLREDHLSACKTVARMHQAAMGGVVCGPKRGVVEDIADLYAEVERLNRVIMGWVNEHACMTTNHRRELAEYRAIITKLSHRLGCMRKRRKRELMYYRKMLWAFGGTDEDKARMGHRLADIEDKLYRLFVSLRGGPLMVRCVHCAATFTGTVPDTHWRTCSEHPARAEVEQLKALLEGKPNDKPDTA